MTGSVEATPHAQLLSQKAQVEAEPIKIEKTLSYLLGAPKCSDSQRKTLLLQPQPYVPAIDQKAFQCFQQALQLTPTETQDMQALINSWQLTQGIPLIDLLGVHINNNIKIIKENLKDMHIFAALQRIYKNLFYIYAGYLREMVNHPKVEPFATKYGSSKEEVSKNLGLIIDLLSRFEAENILQVQKTHQVSRHQFATKREWLAEKYRIKQEQGIIQHVQLKETNIKDVIKFTTLLLKIFNHENGYHALFSNLYSFKGIKQFQPSRKFKKCNVENLVQLSAYFAELMQDNGRLNMSLKMESFQKMIPLLERMKSGFPKDVTAFQKQLSQERIIASSQFNQYQLNYHAAVRGELTYAAWRKQKKLKPPKQDKVQEDFIEFVCVQYIQALWAQVFLAQISTNFYNQIVFPTFNQSLNHHDNAHRLILNLEILKLSKPLPRENGSPLEEGFSLFFDESISTINRLFLPVEESPQFLTLKNNTNSLFLEALIEDLDLLKISPLLSIVEQVKVACQKATIALEEFLQKNSSQLQLLSSNQLDSLKENCWNKSLYFIRMYMILDDLNTVLQSGFNLDLEPKKLLPDEVVDFLCLIEELESYFSPVQEIPSNLPEVVKQESPDERKGGLQPPRPKPLKKASPDPIALEALRRQKRREKIEAILMNKGLTLKPRIMKKILLLDQFKLDHTKGSHATYVHSDGRQFTLPAHDEETSVGVTRQFVKLFEEEEKS